MLQLHFLKTAPGDTSMLLVHPDQTVLFDTPLDVDPPYPPDLVMMTKSDEAQRTHASLFNYVHDTPVSISRIESSDFHIEPCVAIAKSNTYGYTIKYGSTKIAYAPYLERYQSWLSDVDIAVVDASCADLPQIVKSVKKCYVVNGVSPLAPSLNSGEVLTLTAKAVQPVHTRAAAHYRAADDPIATCANCRYYLSAVSKSAEAEEITKGVETTEHQVRVRVRSPSDFEPGSFRSHMLSESEGISAIVGKLRGQSSMSVQALRFDRAHDWTEEKARAWASKHNYQIVAKSAIGRCLQVIGEINPDYTCNLYDSAGLMPLCKSVRQPFGSPGGKRAMAKRILTMMPEHDTYVEPYAGGAAVYFAKDASAKEVLNDLDTNIAQAYKDLREIQDPEVKQLARMNWTVSKALFKRLKNSTPNTRVGRLYNFLYKRGAAYGNYTQPSASHEGKIMKVASRIPVIRDRLANTIILNKDAVDVIKRFDSPTTFFFLDPPYPTEWKFDGNTGSANSNEWNGPQFRQLLEVLKHVKGKFLLTLEEEVQKLIPENFFVKKIPMQRQMSLGPKGKLGTENELLVSNYPFDSEYAKSVPASPDDLFFDVIEESPDNIFAAFQKSEPQRLLWTVNMVPYKVDMEGHWQSEDEIARVAHDFMLKDIPIWSEHEKKVSGVFPVESYTLLADLHIKKSDGSDRIVKKGSWVTVLWFENESEWAKVRSGDYTGTSIRGFAKALAGSPPADERSEIDPTKVLTQ